MNSYESEIIKLNKRIKVITDNPDPTKMKSNKLMYELERDLNVHRLKQWKDGVPFADGLYPTLLRSMGFEAQILDMAADRSQLATSHFETIGSLGLPQNACDRTTVLISMAVNKELAPPSLLVSQNRSCDPLKLAYNTLGRLFGTPIRCLDHGLEANNDTLGYVTDQIGDIIEFAEKKIPGIKYDESRLMELQEADRIGFNYLRDIYELRKKVPCPLSGKDAFRIPIPPSHFHDQKRALEYFKAWHEEMGERAEKGVGAIAEEKLRVLWAVSGPFFANPFAILEKRGVSVPWFMFDQAARFSGIIYGYYGDEKEYGRKLSPLEEEARMLNSHSWGGLASRWVRDVLYIARDLNIDAIINFRQVGCTATVGLAKILEEKAESELGIPTLQMEGRQLFPSYFDPVVVNTQLDVFIDSCMRRKAEKKAQPKGVSAS